jgi:hypothetical protein
MAEKTVVRKDGPHLPLEINFSVIGGSKTGTADGDQGQAKTKHGFHIVDITIYLRHAATAGTVFATNFVSDGSRNARADILLDGVSATSEEQNTGISKPLYVPPADAVQEYRV